MTGALIGAHIGPNFAQSLPLERMEEGPEFAEYLRALAKRLSTASETSVVKAATVALRNHTQKNGT